MWSPIWWHRDSDVGVSRGGIQTLGACRGRFGTAERLDRPQIHEYSIVRMKAAVLYSPDRPLVIRDDVDVPALRSGQVLVKLAYSGVCHSQLLEARGKRGPDAYLPHLLGHEGSGVVLEIGPGVSKVAPGDLVILGWIKGGGIDAGGTKYHCPDGVLNAGAVTTFSEQAVVSENRCVKLPPGLPLDVGALFGCAVLTGAGMVVNTVRPEPGAAVAVYGLGGIGMSALMALAAFDCDPLIGIDISPDKLQMASELGATHVIDASEVDPVAAVRAMTGGRGVDYSIEAAGRSSTIEQAFESVRRGGGRCVFASHPPHGERIRLDPFELISGKEIAGSWGGGTDPDRDIPIFADLYLRGRLPLERLLTNRYPLEGVNAALDDIEGHQVGRPLLELDSSLGTGW